MITLQNLTLYRGTKCILDQANLRIHAGEKIGLVGCNGAGKSTLFALLTGALHESAGQLQLKPDWRIAQVVQDMPESAQSAIDFVLAGDTVLAAKQAALVQAQVQEDGMAIAQAHADLADVGAHDAHARVQALLLGLGFAKDSLNQPVNTFSGGWRMRLQLARTLIAPSDLLLLDEPTNHLDLETLVWLESWLKRYTGTVLLISHDREFLDATTRITVHIDHTTLQRYSGNYSDFQVYRAQQLQQQHAAHSRQQEKIAHMQHFIERFRAKATKARQAQSRMKALERMQRIAPVMAQADFSFEFTTPPQLPNPMLKIEHASMGYAAEDQSVPYAILQRVQCSVLPGQRIGVLGANGQGKSTFIKTLAGTLPLLDGTIQLGKGLRIAYFAQQELDILQKQENPLQHMQRLAKQHPDIATKKGREQDLRNFLGGFLFVGDMVSQPIETMSGGEKARLVLAMMVWQQPNLLLLDEPTNHLDLETRQALAFALNSFGGSLMLVSHDRALLRSVCDTFWLVGQGGVSEFDGSLQDYQDHVLKQNQSDVENPVETTQKTSAAEQRRARAEQRQQYLQQRRPLQKQQAELDQKIDGLQQQLDTLQQKLCEDMNIQERADYGKQYKATEQQLQHSEEEWLDVSNQLEVLDCAYDKTQTQ